MKETVAFHGDIKRAAVRCKAAGHKKAKYTREFQFKYCAVTRYRDKSDIKKIINFFLM